MMRFFKPFSTLVAGVIIGYAVVPKIMAKVG
jgi:hypothetical protein